MFVVVVVVVVAVSLFRLHTICFIVDNLIEIYNSVWTKKNDILIEANRNM